MREFLHDLFNLRLRSQLFRRLAMAWTLFFAGYELVFALYSPNHFTHATFMVVQVIVFIMFLRAKIVA